MLTDAQHAARALYIGGSDAPWLAGLLVKYGKTPEMLWEIKCGLREPEPENEQQYWGTAIEPLMARALVERHGWDIIYPVEPVVSLAYPWMRCSPDAYGAPEHRPTHGVIEFKNTKFLTKDGPRDYQELQLQHNLAVCGMQWGALAILLGGCELKVFEYERDEAIIEPLIELERRFWKMVEAREWREDWRNVCLSD